VIGGLGSDALNGGSGDDILIGGSTTLDANSVALEAILAERQSTDSYAIRTGAIRAGVGASAAKLAWGTTVLDDAAVDSLLGQGGLDWFFGPATGTTVDGSDRSASAEQLN
jgi:hypothetical protein